MKSTNECFYEEFAAYGFSKFGELENVNWFYEDVDNRVPTDRPWVFRNIVRDVPQYVNLLKRLGVNLPPSYKLVESFGCVGDDKPERSTCAIDVLIALGDYPIRLKSPHFDGIVSLKKGDVYAFSPSIDHKNIGTEDDDESCLVLRYA